MSVTRAAVGLLAASMAFGCSKPAPVPASSTVVIVTSDHGRAALFREHGPSYPESGRSFLLAFGGRVPKRGDTCAHADVWLTDIAPTIRALLGLPPDPAPEVVGKPIAALLGP